MLKAHPSVINIKVRGARGRASTGPARACLGPRPPRPAPAGGRSRPAPAYPPPPPTPSSPPPAARQAKTHEKVDSIGEERSIGCHAVVMLIRKP
jgi:hypothetical protein